MARRNAHLSQSLGGMWFGDQNFGPISGETVFNEWRRSEKELFEADWVEARERLGDWVILADLHRTPGQRARRRVGGDGPALSHRSRRWSQAPALLTVLVDYETLSGRMCELANGTVISPGTLVEWLDRSWIERVVFDGPSRVIDVGVTQRLSPAPPAEP